MLSLLVRRAHTGRIAAASPLHSAAAASAATAASALSLRSLVQRCAPTAASLSLRCAAAVSCARSPLLRFACAATNAATLTNQPRRSLHCSSSTRVHSGSDGSDATSKGKQSRRPQNEQRGSQSKGETTRKEQGDSSDSRSNKGKQGRAATNSAATAASKAERKAAPTAAHTSATVAPTSTVAGTFISKLRRTDRAEGAAPLTGTATRVYPFRFKSRSGQSEQLQRAMHQLKVLSFQFTDKFPMKSRNIAGSIDDITQKMEWQSMRAQAKQLLASLLASSNGSADGRLSLEQCEKMLFACKDFRLTEESLLVLRAMLGNGNRVSARCGSMLLECVVKSPEWAAQTGDTAPCGDHPELSALCADRPPPSAELCGTELALWMLASMLSPKLRDRFDVDVFAWTAVLRGLIQVAGRDPRRLQRARGFYERIPNKNEVVHTMMINAYHRAGMDIERDALQQLIEVDPTAAASPEFANAQLANIYSKLDTPQRRADRAANRSTQPSTEERELLRKAEQLWSEATKQPAERMDAVVTGSMLKVIALLGDIPRMLMIIREAIELEQVRTLVLVHPACYCLLFDSMSESDDPSRWKAEANDAWDQMRQRQADAQTRNLLDRANRLRLDEAALSAYMRYLQLTQQRDELESLWRSTPRHLRDGNEQLFTARLKVLAQDGDAVAAERIIGEMPSFNVQPHVQHFAAWLGCHKKGGRWAEAERVWQRMLDSGVKPESYCYRQLMMVYMNDGSPAQVAKIDRLYVEMLQSIPAGMSAGDYQHLIKRAHLCRLPSEARKWSERAKSAGLWKQLDRASHTIVATIDEWKNLPRDPKSD